MAAKQPNRVGALLAHVKRLIATQWVVVLIKIRIIGIDIQAHNISRLHGVATSHCPAVGVGAVTHRIQWRVLVPAYATAVPIEAIVGHVVRVKVPTVGAEHVALILMMKDGD